MPPRRQSHSRYTLSDGTSAPSSSSRLDLVRAGVCHLFTGRSTVRSRASTPDSPKSPRFVLGLPNLSRTRLNIPYLTRTPSRSNTQPSNRSPTPSSRRPASPPTQPSSQSGYAESIGSHVQQPVASARPRHVRQHSGRRFVGVDPAELHLLGLAQSGRSRRRHKRRSRGRTCAPKIKSRKIRIKILSCFVSGMFLTLILTIYLALALSNRNESSEFHVLLILIILSTTIFFCHSLIRLCMMLVKPPAELDLEQQLPAMMEPGGYANPETPIRVALTRDEEAVGIESDATKIPPPAYGLWRESVRVDPNRIFWQRNDTVALEQQNSVDRTEAHSATANRPPSYISEDGVDYVIEAAPRSIAPTTDVPLPPHPSEMGRGWPRQ